MNRVNNLKVVTTKTMIVDKGDNEQRATLRDAVLPKQCERANALYYGHFVSPSHCILQSFKQNNLYRN